VPSASLGAGLWVRLAGNSRVLQPCEPLAALVAAEARTMLDQASAEQAERARAASAEAAAAAAMKAAAEAAERLRLEEEAAVLALSAQSDTSRMQSARRQRRAVLGTPRRCRGLGAKLRVIGRWCNGLALQLVDLHVRLRQHDLLRQDVRHVEVLHLVPESPHAVSCSEPSDRDSEGGNNKRIGKQRQLSLLRTKP
jgi:hypothetical protein